MTGAYVTAKEIADMCGISESNAYRVIRRINDELKAEGYIVFRGRVPRDRLMARLGLNNKKQS